MILKIDAFFLGKTNLIKITLCLKDKDPLILTICTPKEFKLVRFYEFLHSLKTSYSSNNGSIMCVPRLSEDLTYNISAIEIDLPALHCIKLQKIKKENEEIRIFYYQTISPPAIDIISIENNKEKEEFDNLFSFLKEKLYHQASSMKLAISIIYEKAEDGIDKERDDLVEKLKTNMPLLHIEEKEEISHSVLDYKDENIPIHHGSTANDNKCENSGKLFIKNKTCEKCQSLMKKINLDNTIMWKHL